MTNKFPHVKLPLCIKGELYFSGDKSISHRALMFGALATGKTQLTNVNSGDDVKSTIRVLSACGVEIIQNNDATIVNGNGFKSLKLPIQVLDCGNSGTTARLMMGLCAGEGIRVEMTGDASLRKRPMDRVLLPLRRMGAHFLARSDKFLPIMLSGDRLNSLNCVLPVASAQIKSALILAGLQADGITTITSPRQSRDHSERMLSAMGANIHIDGFVVTVEKSTKPLKPINMHIPGDVSSAAFFIVAATLLKSSEIIIKDVSLNPTRTAFLDYVESMGGFVNKEIIRTEMDEPSGNVLIKSAELTAYSPDISRIPNLIDELPLVALLASQATGTTIIKGAGELRFKESDRIKAIVTNLKKWNVNITELEDGFEIIGPNTLTPSSIESFGDHRIAMMMTIAALVAGEDISKLDFPEIAISFPEFFTALNQLIQHD